MMQTSEVSNARNILSRIFPTSRNNIKYILILLIISIILTIVGVVIQNYNDDPYSGWLLAITYIDIILIILCITLHVNSIYVKDYEKFE